jgi:hypothetical protein
MGKKWTIDFDDFNGGYAPGFWENTYPSKGSLNQAGNLKNVDLTDPAVIKQGPSLTALTNDASVTTRIKGITKGTISSEAYAVGGTELYETNQNTVTSDGNWPHTIDKAAVTGESGEDVIVFKDEVLYSYNHSGSAGDIGRLTPSGPTFDDDWWTAAASATALQDAAHQMVGGGDDVLYIANGRYVATFSGSFASPTVNDKALDLPTGYEIESIVWAGNRLYIAANLPSTSAFTIRQQAAIFIWDGIASSWEDQPVQLAGKITALYVTGSTIFVFYQDTQRAGMVKLARLNGRRLEDLTELKNQLPKWYSITDWKNHIIWGSSSNGKIGAYGSSSSRLPARYFDYTVSGVTNNVPSGMAAPFIQPFVASSNTLERIDLSGHVVDCSWKSLLIDATKGDKISFIDKLVINTDVLAANSQLDLKLVDNQGTTLWSDSLSHTTHGAVTRKEFEPKVNCENFRLELDWSNGNTTNGVDVRRVIVMGRYMKGTI